MTISPTVTTMPDFQIRAQLFHVPGAAVQGGFTSGGAQFIVPEVGGFGQLEIQPALMVDEWALPLASWIMSKGNGAVVRVRLAPTPQIAWSARKFQSVSPVYNYTTPFGGELPWEGDAIATFDAAALEGAVSVDVDMTNFGQILQVGHVIGHAYETYLIDAVSWTGMVATLTISPPLRRDVAEDDPALLRPWFTGRILNAGEFNKMYEATDNGHIALDKIVMGEAIVP